MDQISMIERPSIGCDQTLILSESLNVIFEWLRVNYSSYTQCQNSIKKNKMLLELELLVDDPSYTSMSIKVALKLWTEQYQKAKIWKDSGDFLHTPAESRDQTIYKLCPYFEHIEAFIGEKESIVLIKRNQWESDGVVAGKNSIDVLINWLQLNYQKLKKKTFKVMFCEEVVQELKAVGITHRTAVSIRSKIITLETKLTEMLQMLPLDAVELLSDAVCECIHKRLPLFPVLCSIFGYEDYTLFDIPALLLKYANYKPTLSNYFPTWSKDVALDGRNCQDILLDWLGKPGNFSRCCNKNNSKISIAFEISRLITAAGLSFESVEGIIQKITRLETSVETITETFGLPRDADGNKVLNPMILSRYPFYYDLVDIFSQENTKVSTSNDTKQHNKDSKAITGKTLSWKKELACGQSAEEILISLLKIDNNFAMYKSIPPNVDVILKIITDHGFVNRPAIDVIKKISKIEQIMIKFRHRVVKNSKYNKIYVQEILAKKCPFYLELEPILFSSDLSPKARNHNRKISSNSDDFYKSDGFESENEDFEGDGIDSKLNKLDLAHGPYMEDVDGKVTESSVIIGCLKYDQNYKKYSQNPVDIHNLIQNMLRTKELDNQPHVYLEREIGQIFSNIMEVTAYLKNNPDIEQTKTGIDKFITSKWPYYYDFADFELSDSTSVKRIRQARIRSLPPSQSLIVPTHCNKISQKQKKDNKLRWDSDAIQNGLSSQQILNQWLNLGDNYSKYKLKEISRAQSCTFIRGLLVDAGIDHRAESSIDRRIIQMEQDYKNVQQWLKDSQNIFLPDQQKVFISTTWPAYFDLHRVLSKYNSCEEEKFDIAVDNKLNAMVPDNDTQYSSTDGVYVKTFDDCQMSGFFSLLDVKFVNSITSTSNLWYPIPRNDISIDNFCEVQSDISTTKIPPPIKLIKIKRPIVAQNEKTRSSRYESRSISLPDTSKKLASGKKLSSGVRWYKQLIWSQDGVNGGESSQAIFQNWFTTVGNFERYAQGDYPIRLAIFQEICDLFIAQGISNRTTGAIETRIYKTIYDFQSAHGLILNNADRQNSGQCVEVLRKCPQYYLYHPFMADQKVLPARSNSTVHIADAENSNQSSNRLWDSDGVDGGKSSHELLMEWLKFDDNINIFKPGYNKSTYLNDFQDILLKHGIHRGVKSIGQKISSLVEDINSAKDWMAGNNDPSIEENTETILNGKWPHYCELRELIIQQNENETQTEINDSESLTVDLVANIPIIIRHNESLSQAICQSTDNIVQKRISWDETNQNVNSAHQILLTYLSQNYSIYIKARSLAISQILAKLCNAGFGVRTSQVVRQRLIKMELSFQAALKLYTKNKLEKRYITKKCPYFFVILPAFEEYFNDVCQIKTTCEPLLNQRACDLDTSDTIDSLGSIDPLKKANDEFKLNTYDIPFTSTALDGPQLDLNAYDKLPQNGILLLS